MFCYAVLLLSVIAALRLNYARVLESLGRMAAAAQMRAFDRLRAAPPR